LLKEGAVGLTGAISGEQGSKERLSLYDDLVDDDETDKVVEWRLVIDFEIL